MKLSYPQVDHFDESTFLLSHQLSLLRGWATKPPLTELHFRPRFDEDLDRPPLLVIDAPPYDEERLRRCRTQRQMWWSKITLLMG